MSLLKDLEQRFETLLEGFFARQFKSGVQPVEIAKKLSREMDAHRTISVSKIYVPNHYIVRVSKQDADRLKPFERTLLGELQSFLLEHAKKEGYDLVECPRLELQSASELSLGEIRIESTLASPELNTVKSVDQTNIKPPSMTVLRRAQLVRLDSTGEKALPVGDQAVSIGRSTDNTIVIDDPNVSRYHALLEANGSSYILRDLESTNGTFVNGTRISAHSLRNSDMITIGTTKLQFRREARV